MGGSAGLLPFRTPSSGRALYCPTVQPQVGLTNVHIPVAMREPPSPMLPRPRSTRSRRSCSACCSWNDCNYLVPSTRGRHRAACTLSGRVKKRATPIERVLAWVCREAGTRPFRRIPPRHERGRGCQPWQTHRGLGARPSLLWRCTACSGHHTPLCLDTRGRTAPQRGRCGRCCAGQCQERQRSQVPRAGCFQSLQTRRRGSRQEGGEEAVDFVKKLSIAKVEDPLSWERRWTRMLSVVCATAFAASLVEPARQCESICWTGGDAPLLADLLW